MRRIAPSLLCFLRRLLVMALPLGLLASPMLRQAQAVAASPTPPAPPLPRPVFVADPSAGAPAKPVLGSPPGLPAGPGGGSAGTGGGLPPASGAVASSTPSPTPSGVASAGAAQTQPARAGAAQPQAVAAAASPAFNFASPAWNASVPATSPPARYYAAGAYDSSRHQDLVFGGSNGTFLSDTWTWDGTNWTQRPVQGPSPRDVSQMAYDPLTNTTVLFGGYSSSGMLGDTWSWNGSSWTRLSPPTSPPARGEGALAYVPAISKLVLFGGLNGASVPLNDTWTFDGTTWAQLAPPSAPTPRQFPGMEYDSSAGRLVLYGGYNGTTWGDTWTFDGTSWAQQFPAHTPGPRFAHGLAFDPVLQRVLLFGGNDGASIYNDVWMWTGSDWQHGATATVPTARYYVVMVPAANNGQLMVFGGADPAGNPLGDTQTADWSALGEQRAAKLETFPVDDRSSLHVNVGTGNVVVDADDVKVAGTGLSLGLGRFYNSRAALIHANLGNGWFLGTGRDVFTSFLPDGSLVINGLEGSMNQMYFHRNADGTFTDPPGLDATFTSASTLTFHQSREVLTFDASGLLSSDRDRNGNTIRFTYDPATSLLTGVTDTQGRSYTLSYNADGTLASISGSGRLWSYLYTSGYLTGYRDPSGALTQYGYNASGVLSQVIDPVGNITDITYDNFTRVKTVGTETGPGASDTTSYGYFPAPGGSQTALRTTSTDPMGKGHTTTYDVVYAGQVTKVTDALGRLRSTSYTPDNNVSKLTDAMATPGITNFTYDGKNNLTKAQAPDVAGGAAGSGRSTTFSYADAAHPYSASSTTDAQGHATTFGYDTPGNLTTTTDALASQNTSTRTFNPNGTVATEATAGGSCTVPISRCTRYTYDAVGNLRVVSPPSPLGQTSVVPDPLTSRVASVSDANGQKTTYTYDALDRVTQVLFAGATTCVSGSDTCITYGYDQAGSLRGRTDVTGSTTWTYDAHNRPLSKSVPGGLWAASTVSYDPAGNVAAYTDSGGTVSYAYDAANQVVALAEPGGQLTCSPSVHTAKCTAFAYDANGFRTKVSYPSGQTITLAPDTSGREASISSVRPSGAVIASRTYTYTQGGGADADLRHSVKDEAGVTTTYSYDVLNRLTAAQAINAAGAKAGRYSYGYDAAGNRTTSSVISPSGVAGPTTSYAYNTADELCWSLVASSTNSCAAPPAGATTYRFDAKGNLTSSSAGFSTTYNAKDQPTNMVANGQGKSFSYADAGSTERTRSGTDKLFNGLFGVSATSRNGTYFTRDPAGNLISMRQGQASYYYTLDALGSVVALTDSTGSTDMSRYSYDPYGGTTVSSSSVGADNPFAYASGYREPTLGLYKFGARYYDPGVGRWTQRDPSGRDPGYSYVGSNPVSRVDPTGLDIFGDIASGVSDLLDLAGGALSAGIEDALNGAGYGFAIGAVVGCVTGGIGGAAGGSILEPGGGTLAGAIAGCIVTGGTVGTNAAVAGAVGGFLYGVISNLLSQ